MRLGKLFFMLFLALTFLVFTQANAKEAKNLKELIQMYDTKECQTCHADYFKDWEKSLHSKPLLGPFDKTLGTLKDYIKQRDDELKKSKDVTKSTKEYLMPCFICHIPQLQDLSEEGANELVEAVMKENLDMLYQLNINCLICHNRNALVRKYRDGNPEPDAVYGVKETGAHAAPSYPKRIKAEMMKDPSFCGGCHQGPNVLHSAEPIWCVSNYDSYLQAYIPSDCNNGSTCQSCHMAKTDDNKTGHRFPPNYDDKELSMKRLHEAVQFDFYPLAYIFQIKTPEKKSIPKVVVKTTINHNIAHRFPDGCPSPTHFLLEVTIKDSTGAELKKFTKYLMPQLKLGYEENKMVFASLRKLSLMRDTSLQPCKKQVDEFEFDLPEGVKDVKVQGKLTFVVEPGVASSVFELYNIEKDVSLGNPKQ
jgi:hypothetical protein